MAKRAKVPCVLRSRSIKSGLSFQRTILSQSSQPTDFAQSEACFDRFSIPDPLIISIKFLSEIEKYLAMATLIAHIPTTI